MDMFGNFCYKITHIGMQFLPLGSIQQIALLILQFQQGKSLRKRQSISCRLFHSVKPGRQLPNVAGISHFPPGCYVSPVAYEVRHAPLVYWVRKK